MVLLAIDESAGFVLGRADAAAWLAGPLVAWWISQPYRRPEASLPNVHHRQVRRWARQTWHYFETFMNEHEHWLPPDNVQEHPRAIVATRTSPTNIGLGLLSGLAAYDLGYLPGTALIERTRAAPRHDAAFGTLPRALLQLVRYRAPFRPSGRAYVSSVDSGKLVGRPDGRVPSGLDELRDRPVVPPRFLEGLQDTLEVIAALRSASMFTAFDDPFDACLGQLSRQCGGSSPRSARLAHELLCRIRALAATLASTAPANRPALRQWTSGLLAAVGRRPRRSAAVGVLAPHAGVHSRSGNGSGTILRGFVPRDRQAGRTLHARRSCRKRAGKSRRRISRLVETISKGGNRNGDADLPGAVVLSCVRRAAERAALAASEQRKQIADLRGLCRQFCKMDFRFLFHPQRKLLSIGFQVRKNRRDNSFYDLLASEARLTSFLAVSHGQLPPEHWFALGRTMTLADGKAVLLSWSGSMFEYLMPALFMPSYPGTLLRELCRCRAAADPLCTPLRRTVGHLRKLLPSDR